MATAKDVTALAAGEIGVSESPAGSNTVRYNTEYYGRKVSGGAYPWCVVFLWWVFRQAGASGLFYGGGKTASCGTLRSYAKRHGQWVTADYRPGDILIYDFSGKQSTPEHAGILERVTRSGGLVAIEGNTSAADPSNGGTVRRRSRRVSQVVGAYRPAYDTERKAITVPASQVRRGDRGSHVLALQVLLNGVAGAGLEVDGVAEVSCGVQNKKLKSLLESASIQPPVVVEMRDGTASITLHLMMQFGARIPSVAEKVQENVKSAVQNMTNVTVSRVDLVIAGLAEAQ